MGAFFYHKFTLCIPLQLSTSFVPTNPQTPQQLISLAFYLKKLWSTTSSLASIWPPGLASGQCAVHGNTWSPEHQQPCRRTCHGYGSPTHNLTIMSSFSTSAPRPATGPAPWRPSPVQLRLALVTNRSWWPGSSMGKCCCACKLLPATLSHSRQYGFNN